MWSDQELTPLGALLEYAREEVLHLSARQAAARAGITGTRWKQIVTGVERRAGQLAPTKGTARTVVAMALAVEVDPAEALGAAGFEDSPHGVEALVRDVREQLRAAPEAERAADQGRLADEIERIRGLSLEPDDKIRIARALISMYQEKEGSALDATSVG